MSVGKALRKTIRPPSVRNDPQSVVCRIFLKNYISILFWATSKAWKYMSCKQLRRFRFWLPKYAISPSSRPSRISLRKARLLFLVLAEWMNREPWKYMAHESTYACFTFDFQNIQYDPKVCPCKIVPWKAYCTLFLLRCAHSLTTHVLHWNYVNFIFDLPSIQHDPRIITFENDSAKSLHFVYRVLRCTESVKIHVLDKQLRRNFARNVQHSI